MWKAKTEERLEFVDCRKSIRDDWSATQAHFPDPPTYAGFFSIIFFA